MSDMNLENYKKQFEEEQNEDFEITVTHSVRYVNPKYVKWLEEKLNQAESVSNNEASAFSEKQRRSLLYSARHIIDQTNRIFLSDKADLSDEVIIKIIEEDFFSK